MKVYLLLLCVAIGVTAIVTPVVRWGCLRWRILPRLRARDIQAVPVPRLGGVAMTIGFVITLLIASRIPYMEGVYSTGTPWAVLGGAVAVCALGVADDLLELDWFTKLSGQVLVVGVMAWQGIQLISFPIFGITIGSSRLSLIVTVFVIVGIMNAVNFIDGLDGLAAGVVGIGATGFFIYSYLLSRELGSRSYATSASLIVISLVGICLGFLWFNYHPSSIMMGGGAEVLGLILAAGGVIVTGQIDPLILGRGQVLAGFMPIILPLAVMIVPIGDLFITALGRVIAGKSPFHADRSHVHDHLLARGHSHRAVVAILYVWTALVAGSVVALLVLPWQQVLMACIPLTFIAVIFTLSEFPWLRKRKDDCHIYDPISPSENTGLDNTIEHCVGEGDSDE